MQKAFTPRPYQHLIIDHVIDAPRSNVWASMGLGKTISALTAIEDLFMCGAETQPVLVLAPLRVARSTWPDEVDKWNHLRNIEMQPIVGTVKERLAALQNTNASVYTTNYDNLVWLVETLGDRWPFGTVVADESTRLKSFRLRQGGKRAAALAKVAHKHVHRWMNLTGTPAPNGLIDLWGQAWFVDQGSRLGRTFGAFTSRWFNNIQFPGQQWSKLEPRPFAQEQMQAALRDVTISLDAADWFDIEEPIHNVIRVQMPAKAQQQYQEMEKQMFLELDGTDIEAPNAAAKTVKCLQMCVAGDSEILTNNGWKRINNVTISDRLWDGVEWVRHSGVISRGVRQVIHCWDAVMTPNHQVLTDEGWRKAEEIINAKSDKKFSRSNFRLPEGYQTLRKHDNKTKTRHMASEMYLWERIYSYWDKPHKPESLTPKILWLQEGRNVSKGSRFPRKGLPPDMEHLVPNALPLWKSTKQRLEKLWCQRNKGLCSLARLIRRIYVRYGAVMACRIKPGSNRQLKGIFSRKLPLGYSTGAKQEPTHKRSDQHTQRFYDRCRSGGNLRTEHGHTPCETIQIRISGKESLNPTSSEEVFDILSAGPRNRFVMRGTSAPFISHNCNGAIYTDDKGTWASIHDAKLQALESVITESGGMPVLVAYHFKSDLVRLLKAFPKGKQLDADPQTLRDWNAGKIPVLFAHPASAGHGLNLQDGGNILAFFSHWWDLEQYQQIIERIGPTRQIQAGHNRPVWIHHIIAADTVDELVMQRRDSKRKVQDILLEAMKKRGLKWGV